MPEREYTVIGGKDLTDAKQALIEVRHVLSDAESAEDVVIAKLLRDREFRPMLVLEGHARVLWHGDSAAADRVMHKLRRALHDLRHQGDDDDDGKVIRPWR